MFLTHFLWLALAIGGRKTPLPPCFKETVTLEELKRYDTGVTFQRITDEDGHIVIWSNDPSVLFQNLPKCPWMHHTYVETLHTIMKTLIHKASPFKRDTDPFDQDRFEEVWKVLQENMEKHA